MALAFLCPVKLPRNLLSCSVILQMEEPAAVTIASANEIALAEAKDRARKLLLDMRGGTDPKAKAKPTTGTLQETLDAYLQSPRLSARSKEIYSRVVRLYLAPLQNVPLAAITPAQVDTLHNTIASRSAANLAVRVLRLLFNWSARRNDELGRNPVRLHGAEWHQITPRRNPIPPESASQISITLCKN